MVTGDLAVTTKGLKLIRLHNLNRIFGNDCHVFTAFEPPLDSIFEADIEKKAPAIVITTVQSVYGDVCILIRNELVIVPWHYVMLQNAMTEGDCCNERRVA